MATPVSTDAWSWTDCGATVEVEVRLVGGRVPAGPGGSVASVVTASARVSPRRFTLSIHAEGAPELVLEVEELLNVVDPRGSTTTVDQARPSVTVSLAKWGPKSQTLWNPWPTLVQEPPSFENDPRSPYENVLAQETAPPPDQLLKGLWIGGIGSPLGGRRWFEEQEVTHSLSVCDYWPHSAVNVTRLVLDVTDDTSTDLQALFPQAVRYMDAARLAGGCVYIHCRYGASRSATVAVAYLLCLVPTLCLGEALEYARSVRPSIDPIGPFLEQLREFEKGEQLAALRLELGSQHLRRGDDHARISTPRHKL